MSSPREPERPSKPKIQLSERPTKSGSKLWVVLGVLAGIALAGYAAVAWARQPDPHYVEASKLVHNYEIGRSVGSRNYNNPIYQQALDELDLVDPDSISAEPAQELREEIEHGRQVFLARAQANQQNKSQVSEKRRIRREQNLENHRRHVVIPESEYAECDHEEADDHAGH